MKRHQEEGLRLCLEATCPHLRWLSTVFSAFPSVSPISCHVLACFCFETSFCFVLPDLTRFPLPVLHSYFAAVAVSFGFTALLWTVLLVWPTIIYAVKVLRFLHRVYSIEPDLVGFLPDPNVGPIGGDLVVVGRVGFGTFGAGQTDESKRRRRAFHRGMCRFLRHRLMDGAWLRKKRLSSSSSNRRTN